MPKDVTSQILDVYYRVKSEKDYQRIWNEYEYCNDKLWDWAQTLPEEQYSLLDDYIAAFFAVHMQMMEIALRKQ